MAEGNVDVSTRGYHENKSPRQRRDEALLELRQHPGWVEYGRCEAIRWSLTAVFEPNLHELLALLDAASTNQVLALQLIQNTAAPVVADAFHRELAQRLHNYLAAATSLIDHVRRLMRGRTGAIAAEFEQRKRALYANAEVSFVQDLRNYAVHRSLPVTGHKVAMRQGAEPAFESEVTLSIPHLLEWGKWTARSRDFLAQQGTSLALRHVIRRHGSRMRDLNAWLYNSLSSANEAALTDANRLVVAVNAHLMGVSLDEAERHTRRMTERRHLPAPKQG